MTRLQTCSSRGLRCLLAIDRRTEGREGDERDRGLSGASRRAAALPNDTLTPLNLGRCLSLMKPRKTELDVLWTVRSSRTTSLGPLLPRLKRSGHFG